MPIVSQRFKPASVMLLTCLLLAQLVQFVHAQPTPRPALSPRDFAFTRTFELSDGGPLHAAHIPEEVYRTVVREDLGDIRIFNGAGMVVPHEIERARVVVENSVTTSPLVFFPIEGATGKETSSTGVRMTQDSTGRLVSVEFAGHGATPSTISNWYLMDLRDKTAPVRALLLEVTELAPNHIFPLELETSEDLERWQKIRSSGVLARLHFQDQQIEHSRLEFAPTQAKFLRIRIGSDSNVTLRSVYGEFVSTTQTTAPEVWTSVDGERVPSEPRTVVYDTERYLPTHSLKLELPLANTMLRVTIDSRANPEQQWIRRYAGLSYRLTVSGAEVTSPPAELSAALSHRFWRLVVDGNDVALGDALPGLSLGWRPARIVFLAQGEGPFQLAYGGATVPAPDFGVGNLVHPSGHDSIAPAQLRPAVESGGDQKLAPVTVTPALPWKKWSLWAVLCVFIVLVATMALRLWKDMQKAG